MWEAYQQEISDCDLEMQGLLHQMADQPTGPDGAGALIGPVKLVPPKAQGKNAALIERLQEMLARICGGCDATQIPGLGMYLVLQIISEVGT